MIPTHNESGVLPPFIGESPADRACVSPYPCAMSEFLGRFAETEERVELLAGLLGYRAELHRIGIIDGFQWIDGSFLERVESLRGRPPADIDVTTIARRPPSHRDSDAWKIFFEMNDGVLSSESTKKRFHCHSFYIDLDIKSEILVRDIYYWHGLFSHQRNTFLWKGMVEIPLASDDARAEGMLKELQNA